MLERDQPDRCVRSDPSHALAARPQERPVATSTDAARGAAGCASAAAVVAMALVVARGVHRLGDLAPGRATSPRSTCRRRSAPTGRPPRQPTEAGQHPAHRVRQPRGGGQRPVRQGRRRTRRRALRHQPDRAPVGRPHPRHRRLHPPRLDDPGAAEVLGHGAEVDVGRPAVEPELRDGRRRLPDPHDRGQHRRCSSTTTRSSTSAASRTWSPPSVVCRSAHRRRSTTRTPTSCCPPGRHELDGEQALAYVRTRKSVGDGSDLRPDRAPAGVPVVGGAGGDVVADAGPAGQALRLPGRGDQEPDHRSATSASAR